MANAAKIGAATVGQHVEEQHINPPGRPGEVGIRDQPGRGPKFRGLSWNNPRTSSSFGTSAVFARHTHGHRTPGDDRIGITVVREVTTNGRADATAAAGHDDQFQCGQVTHGFRKAFLLSREFSQRNGPIFGGEALAVRLLQALLHQFG